MENNNNVEELDSTQKIEKVENVPSQFDNIKSRTEMAEMSKEEINNIKEHIKEEHKNEESQFIEPTKQTNIKSILFLILIVAVIAGVFYIFPMIRGIFHK